MGKNMTIYFKDEVLELIENLDGKGTLINKMILEYFSNDEETLRRNVENAEREFNALNAKLKMKVKHRLDRAEMQKKALKQSEESQKRQAEIKEVKRLYAAGDISEEDYWEFFDNLK